MPVSEETGDARNLTLSCAVWLANRASLYVLVLIRTQSVRLVASFYEGCLAFNFIFSRSRKNAI
jgi:hypothetical protein